MEASDEQIRRACSGMTLEELEKVRDSSYKVYKLCRDTVKERSLSNESPYDKVWRIVAEISRHKRATLEKDGHVIQISVFMARGERFGTVDKVQERVPPGQASILVSLFGNQAHNVSEYWRDRGVGMESYSSYSMNINDTYLARLLEELRDRGFDLDEIEYS